MLLDSIIDVENAVLQEDQVGCLSYTDVTFIKNFGSFIEGEYYDNIVFDFEEGTLISYANDGTKLEGTHFSLEPTKPVSIIHEDECD